MNLETQCYKITNQFITRIINQNKKYPLQYRLKQEHPTRKKIKFNQNVHKNTYPGGERGVAVGS